MATEIFEKQVGSAAKVVDRRRFDRIRLQVPLFIRGSDSHGEEFLELAKTLDISCSGARIVSARSLQHQTIVHLTVPAPLPRSAKFGECGTGPVSARIRRLEPHGEMEVAAVEFLTPLD